ncbi:MAG: hypothetical protein M3Z08_19685, partial [Chloroflexota bacterium]|nr:hypothetical protein [Chloroflexota bacterium]
MSAVPGNSARRPALRGLAALATLALWRFRDNWRLLALLEGGMLCAVLLVCTAPLFSQVALTAGMRAVLQQTPNAYVNINADSFYSDALEYSSLSNILQDQQQITSVMQKHLGSYIDPAPQLIVTAKGVAMPTGVSQPHHPTGGAMSFQAFQMADIAGHVKLVQGHLPQPDASALEIALLPQVAQLLQMTIGDTITIPLNYVGDQTTETPLLLTSLPNLVVRLVGIFTVNNESDAVWHDTFFETGRDAYHVLASIPGMVDYFGQIEQKAQTQQAVYINNYSLFWYYHLDVVHIDVNHIQTLLNDFATTSNDMSNDPSLTNIYQFTVYDPREAVATYQQRIQTSEIPVMLLLLLIAGLFVIFISTMGELLAEQQALQVAILRSRGASRRQIFVTVGLQSLLLGLVALVLAPWLALLLAHLLTFRLLPASTWGALNVL